MDTTPYALTLVGGATTYRADGSVGVTGTSDAPAGTTVTVDVADTRSEAVVGADGTWSVAAAAVPDGSYPVVASVSGADDAVAVGRQTVVVDSVAPVLTLDGGAHTSVTTSTPRISGTSGEPAGRTVVVAVDGTAVPRALVGVGGTWSVQAPALSAGTHAVQVAVTDGAHTTTATQVLTVHTDAGDTGPTQATRPRAARPARSRGRSGAAAG